MARRPVSPAAVDPAFAVQSIRRWWNMMGRETYPDARQLLITADSGGSNGSRVRWWQLELQKLADETGLEISVCHFPPGTSKWNKIAHRLFSCITKHWRGKPLVSHEVIVNLIAATTTRTGMRVQSQLDTGKYPQGIKVGKPEFAAIHLRPTHSTASGTTPSSLVPMLQFFSYRCLPPACFQRSMEWWRSQLWPARPSAFVPGEPADYNGIPFHQEWLRFLERPISLGDLGACGRGGTAIYSRAADTTHLAPMPHRTAIHKELALPVDIAPRACLVVTTTNGSHSFAKRLSGP